MGRSCAGTRSAKEKTSRTPPQWPELAMLTPGMRLTPYVSTGALQSSETTALAPDAAPSAAESVTPSFER